MTTTPAPEKVLTTEIVLQLSSGKTWSIKGYVDDESVQEFIVEITNRLRDRAAHRTGGSVEYVGENGVRTVVAISHVEGLIIYPMIEEPAIPDSAQ